MKHPKRAVIALSLACALVSGAVVTPIAAAAEGRGVTKASTKTTKAIMGDLGISVPIKCVSAYRSNSKKKFALYGAAAGVSSDCIRYIGEGGSVVVKKKGKTWIALPLGGTGIPCPELKRQFRDSRVPLSVFKDFRTIGICG